MHALWQKSDALIFGLFIRHREDIVKRPQLCRQSFFRQSLPKTCVFVKQFPAEHKRRGVTGSNEVHNFLERAVGIDGYAGSAGLQDAEVRHAPLWCVLARKQHPVARLDSFAGKEARRAQGQLAHVGISVLLFSAIALDTHRHASSVTFGRRLEELEQIAIRVNALWLDAHFFFQRGKHPLLQSG